MQQTLEALAKRVQGRLIGDAHIVIHDVNSLDLAKEGELTFADDSKNLQRALHTKASAILVPSTVTDLPSRAGISVQNPKLAFAQLLELFHPQALRQSRIHPTVVMAEPIPSEPNVDIRAHVVLGHRVRIGQNTLIEAGAVIGDDVTIGEHCLIGPNVVIYDHSIIGHRVAIHAGSVIGGDGFGYVFHQGRHVKIPQVGNVIIEDDVEIGCNTCVDRATLGSTVIRRGAKIDNQVQIAHNNDIGQHVIITGQCGLAGSVALGDYAIMGAKSGVIDHVTIGPQVQVGAGSMVIKSVPAKTKVWGLPARPAKEVLPQIAALSRLPALLKTVARFIERLQRIESRIEQQEHVKDRVRT